MDNKVKTWIKYQEPYLPTPRCRKYRYRTVEAYVDLLIPTAEAEHLHPAIRVGDLTYYRHGTELYVKATVKAIWAGEGITEPLEALRYVNANCSGYFGFAPEDTREKMVIQAQKKLLDYLLVGGVLYVKAWEPCYGVTTFGLGNNHGGTSLAMYEGRFPGKGFFSALDGDLAVAYANEVAKKRGDTEDVGTFHEFIEVLMPEAIQFPRRERTPEQQAANPYKQCDKTCIGNKNGWCCVKDCHGDRPIKTIDVRIPADVQQAAKTYALMVAITRSKED